MTTITIDIPDNKTDEVLAILKKFEVKISTSEPFKLDRLSKEDYKKHFQNRAKANRNTIP